MMIFDVQICSVMFLHCIRNVFSWEVFRVKNSEWKERAKKNQERIKKEPSKNQVRMKKGRKKEEKRMKKGWKKDEKRMKKEWKKNLKRKNWANMIWVSQRPDLNS